MAEFTKRSFTGGEIAHSLRSRVDLNKYQVALAKCKNFMVLPEGGVINRPGFKYLGEVSKSFIIPFQFNEKDSYSLYFSDKRFDIYRYGVHVHSTKSPYSYEDMKQAQYVQSADVITIAHINHPLRTLKRYAHDNWVFDEVSFSYNISPPVGLTVESVGKDSKSDPKTYDYVVTQVIDGKESLQSFTATITTSALSETWGNRLHWQGAGESYNIYKSVSPSTNVFGWIGNSRTNEFTDYNIAPVSSEGVVKNSNPFNKHEIKVTNEQGEIKQGDAVKSNSFTAVVTRKNNDSLVIEVTGDKPLPGNSIQSSRTVFNLASTTGIQPGMLIETGAARGRVISVSGNSLVVETEVGNFANGDAVVVKGATEVTYKVALPVQASKTVNTVVNADDSKTTTTVFIDTDGVKTTTVTTVQPDGTKVTTTATGEDRVSVFSDENSNVTYEKVAGTPLSVGDTLTSTSGATGTVKSTNIPIDNEQLISLTEGDILKQNDRFVSGGKSYIVLGRYIIDVDLNRTITTAPAPSYSAKIVSIEDVSNPSVINYYQQRLMLANTKEQPQTTFASKTSDYYDFRKSEPAGDSDSLEFTIASGQINEIRHIISMKDLLLLTSGGVWKVTEGQNEVLTPSTVGVRKLSHFGSSKTTPLNVGDSTLFLESKETRVRDLYDLQQYQSDDLSILSQHLFHGHKILDWCYQEEPHGIVWAVRDDGVLLGMTYHKAHQVWGWHQHHTQGKFISVTCVTETDKDVVYACIERDGRYYAEQLSVRDDSDYAKFSFMDSFVRGTGKTVTANHLIGKDVVILADGFVYKGKLPFTLPKPATNWIVGLAYTCDIETLPLDANEINSTGKQIAMPSLAVRFDDTVGGDFGQSFDKLTKGKWRAPSDGYNPIAKYSGDYTINTATNWKAKGKVCIRQDNPLPMSILSITPKVIIGGKVS